MTSIPPWSRRTPAPSGQPVERIEPTPEEARNGWDAASLTEYVAEARRRDSDTIRNSMEGRNRPRPVHQSKGASSMRWARRPSWHAKKGNQQ